MSGDWERNYRGFSKSQLHIVFDIFICYHCSCIFVFYVSGLASKVKRTDSLALKLCARPSRAELEDKNIIPSEYFNVYRISDSHFYQPIPLFPFFCIIYAYMFPQPQYFLNILRALFSLPYIPKIILSEISFHPKYIP